MHNWPRRSSSMKSGNARPSLDAFRDRASRAPDRSSRIPLARSTSNHAERGGNAGPPGLVRSKSTLGNFTPQEKMMSLSKVTPQMTPRLFNFNAFSTSKKPAGKDPRDLHDRNFQREAHATIVDYFRNHHPSVLENNDMKPMTLKMFVGMINHLMAQLCVHNKGEPIEFTVGTFETDFPSWLKNLEYPGIVSKGWLKTVNAPHSLPSVLGVLSWLVNMVHIADCFEPFRAFEEMAQVNQEALGNYNYLQALLNYCEDSSDEILEELNDHLCEHGGYSDQRIEELRAEKAKLEQQEQAECPNSAQEEELAAELEQRLTVAISVENKADRDIKSIKEQIGQEIAQKEKTERKCETLIAETRMSKENIVKLKKKIETQTMSVTECLELKRECENLTKDILYMAKEYDENLAVLHRYEVDITARRDKIQQSASNFNRQVIQLAQKVPELQGLRVRLDPESQDIIADVEKLGETLTLIKEKTAGEYFKLDKIKKERMQKINELKKRKDELVAEILAMEQKIAEGLAECKALKERAAQDEKQMTSEISNLEQQVAVFQEQEAENDALREEVADLEKKLDHAKRAEAYYKQKAEEKWQAALQIALHYRNKISDMRDRVLKNEEFIAGEIESLIDEFKKRRTN